MLLDLAGDQSPEGRARLHYFLINKGPWSRLDHNAPFVAGAPPKPEGAGFYPPNATKAELEAWIKSLPAAEQKSAKGFFTVIHRKADGKFSHRPLQHRIRRRADPRRRPPARSGRAATEPTLKKFLTTRADAFLSNDYYPSDVAWMELTGAIEPTIGPYEVYEDGIFQLQSRLRSLHHRAGRGRNGQAAEVLGRVAGHRGSSPDRPEVSQPEARRSRPARGGERNLRRRRRQPRRPDRGLQFA